MRKLAVLLSLLMALAYPGSVFADCSSAPQYIAFGSGYWDYTHNDLTSSDQSCWSFSSSTYLSPVTLSCGYTGWIATAMYQDISQSFTVGSSDSGSSSWELFFRYDMSSPGHYGTDTLTATVTVLHGGQYTSYYWAHSGADGDEACDLDDVLFTAVNGDTVTIDLQLSRSDSSSTVGFTNVHIWRTA